MSKSEKKGLTFGLVLLGLGAGLSTAGAMVLIPYFAALGRKQLLKAGALAQDGLNRAAGALNDAASSAKQPIAGAAQAVKQTTAIAAGAVEQAARHVREKVE